MALSKRDRAELDQQRLDQARRELALFPGCARLDAFTNSREMVLVWTGITEPGGGVIVATADWQHYTALVREFLEFDAIKPFCRRRRALEPARKPAGRAAALSHHLIDAGRREAETPASRKRST
jgi:hypothetical protein